MDDIEKIALNRVIGFISTLKGRRSGFLKAVEIDKAKKKEKWEHYMYQIGADERGLNRVFWGSGRTPQYLWPCASGGLPVIIIYNFPPPIKIPMSKKRSTQTHTHTPLKEEVFFFSFPFSSKMHFRIFFSSQTLFFPLNRSFISY